MEIAALILSVVALVVSIGVAVSEEQRDYELNRINLESVFYKEIYTKHLVTKIPEARNYIRFGPNNELAGTHKMIAELKELRRDSLYFRYQDKAFYMKLNDNIQSLEDILVSNTKKVFNEVQQDEFLESIHKKIEEIYVVISEGYLGEYYDTI